MQGLRKVEECSVQQLLILPRVQLTLFCGGLACFDGSRIGWSGMDLTETGVGCSCCSTLGCSAGSVVGWSAVSKATNVAFGMGAEKGDLTRVEIFTAERAQGPQIENPRCQSHQD